MESTPIEHTVTFRLKHESGSAAEADFIAAVLELAVIPGVNDFQVRRQVCKKNSHTFGVTMKFDSHEDFKVYSNHPLHNEFVEKRFKLEVEDFLEADFENL